VRQVSGTQEARYAPVSKTLGLTRGLYARSCRSLGVIRLRKG